MPWAWVRPADPSVLAGRPLLDLGTGDGRTLDALAGGPGLVVGVDRAIDLLRPGNVNAVADALPFRDASFATVLAADLFHHLGDDGLAAVLGEVSRVLRSEGRLVAWWYERTSDPSPDAPRHPRTHTDFARLARGVPLSVEPLDVLTAVATSPTVAIVARR